MKRDGTDGDRQDRKGKERPRKEEGRRQNRCTQGKKETENGILTCYTKIDLPGKGQRIKDVAPALIPTLKRIISSRPTQCTKEDDLKKKSNMK